MLNDRERWRPIKGYDGEYLISDHGRVKSLKAYKNDIPEIREKIIAPHVTYKNYMRVTLSLRSKRRKHYIARLVAEHFVDKPYDGKLQVNHIDGDKLNNHYLNLEWVTAKENVHHAFENGLRQRKHDHEQIINDYYSGMLYKDIAKKHKTTTRYIVRILELNDIKRGRYKSRK